jgi:hypothetical protein
MLACPKSGARMNRPVILTSTRKKSKNSLSVNPIAASST